MDHKNTIVNVVTAVLIDCHDHYTVYNHHIINCMSKYTIFLVNYTLVNWKERKRKRKKGMERRKGENHKSYKIKILNYKTDKMAQLLAIQPE